MRATCKIGIENFHTHRSVGCISNLKHIFPGLNIVFAPPSFLTKSLGIFIDIIMIKKQTSKQQCNTVQLSATWAHILSLALLT